MTFLRLFSLQTETLWKSRLPAVANAKTSSLCCEVFRSHVALLPICPTANHRTDEPGCGLQKGADATPQMNARILFRAIELLVLC